VDRERAPDRAALRLVCRVPAQAPDPVVLRRVCRVLALAPDPVAPVPARVACASGLTRSRIGVAELARGRLLAIRRRLTIQRSARRWWRRSETSGRHPAWVAGRFVPVSQHAQAAWLQVGQVQSAHVQLVQASAQSAH
jgi:hypothetical protein